MDANPGQGDADLDGIGDACDNDINREVREDLNRVMGRFELSEIERLVIQGLQESGTPEQRQMLIEALRELLERFKNNPDQLNDAENQ